jgi:hypothetical protein
LASWITCSVTSAVQGAAVAVDQSGSRIMSGSVKASKGLSAHSPVIVCRKIEFGRKKLVCLANFAAGMALPRATPAMSPMMHSTSSSRRLPM